MHSDSLNRQEPVHNDIQCGVVVAAPTVSGRATSAVIARQLPPAQIANRTRRVEPQFHTGLCTRRADNGMISSPTRARCAASFRRTQSIREFRIPAQAALARHAMLREGSCRDYAPAESFFNGRRTNGSTARCIARIANPSRRRGAPRPPASRASGPLRRKPPTSAPASSSAR